MVVTMMAMITMTIVTVMIMTVVMLAVMMVLDLIRFPMDFDMISTGV